MMNLRWLLSAVLFVAACTQSPYPGTGKIVQFEPKTPDRVFPPYSLDIPESVEVFEGQTLDFGIVAMVPKPNQPVVTAIGLPVGATFDSQTLRVNWSPDFQAANDPKDESVILRTFEIKFHLESSDGTDTYIERTTLVVVRDFTRPMKLNVQASPILLEEGKAHEQTISVESEDYPDGRFDIQIKGLPASATVSRDLTDPKRQFKITYTPSFRDVVIDEGTYGSKPTIDRKLEVSVFGPRGSAVATSMLWRIADVREKPILLLPAQITQGTNVSFSVSSEDPNGEEPPKLSLAPRPSFGLAELKTEATNPGNPARGVNPSVVSTFRWIQIPPEKIGQSQEVNFRACVKTTRFEKALCSEHKVKVNFEAETHLPPIIDRASLPLGKVWYVKEGKTYSAPVPIKDGEFSNTAPTVKILPDMPEVIWSRGKLEVKPVKAGLKQFSLSATSAFGVTQVESFLMEVLPWNWSSVVVFGEGPNAPEIKATIPLFESVQVANPLLQLSDPRLLVERKVAYLTTGALLEASALPKLETLSTQVTNLIVSTPLLSKLEGALKDEIAALGVSYGTRITDLPNYALEAAAGEVNAFPSDPLKLSGKLGVESASPLPLKAGSDACRPLLVLKKAGEADLPVLLGCKRSSGGKLLVGGIELGDIQASSGDSGLLKRWLSEWVAL
jgi:hypothetical protein